jgi:PKD repeat protein
VLAAALAAAFALVLSAAASAKPDVVRTITRHRLTAANLVANGSFETSLAGWTTYRANLSRVPGGTDGAYSARVALSGGSTSGGFSIVPTTTPVASTAAGTTYTAGAWVKTSRPDLMTCLRIRIYNGSTQTGDVTSCLDGASTWTPFNSVSYDSATAGRRLDVYVYAWNVRKGDSFQVDGISLAAEAPLPPPPPANMPPTARATVSPASTEAGTSVSFDGSASSDADGTIASYEWSYGDGATGTGPTSTHTYAAAGSYDATLTVTDDKGATGSATTTVAVTAPPPPNAPPAARFGFSPAGPEAGASVAFDGSASSDADGTIASYAWSFGDGSSAAGQSAAHVFASAGTYTVTLTVTDDKGATDTASTPLAVTEPPPAPTPSITATAVDNAHVQLTWTPVANGAAYRVSRGALVLGTTTAATFTDALLWPSTQYSYTVQALDAAGALVSTLTASATTTALPASGFQRPFPAASVWNTPVGASPLHPNSAAYSSYFAARAGSANMPLRSWAVGVAEAHPSDTTYSVPCTKYTCTLGAFGAFAIPVTAKQDPSGDGHLAVYDPATQREWDMWQAAPSGSGWTSGAGAAVSMAGNGIAPAGYASGNAANFPLLGGLIRAEEILQGHIDHALVFGMPGVNNTGYVCPATHNDGDTTDPNAPKEGTRFQLDPSVDVDALAIPAWKKTIAKALQTYGMYLRDSSGSFAIYAENPGSRGYDAWALVGLGSGNYVSLGGIPWDRMQAISAPC